MKIGIIALCLTAAVASGQQNLETQFRTSGKTVVAAFDEQRGVLQTSSALIMDGRTEAIYGVVVSSDGHVLTKASDLEMLTKPEIIIEKKRYEEVRILATDPIWDVVLLKCEAESTVPVEYSDGPVSHGSWIVVNGASSRFRRRALVGIISANTREIPVQGGPALGVVLDLKAKPPAIKEVQEATGAKKAGLKAGDVILKIADVTIEDFESVKLAMKERKAGETIEVQIRRGKEELTLEVKLSSKDEIMRRKGMLSRNDQMSGRVSKRRSGFPRVIQHDVLANETIMGGPVLNLEGKCIGMNIARANRAETFAIPSEDLQEIAARLMGEAAEKTDD